MLARHQPKKQSLETTCHPQICELQVRSAACIQFGDALFVEMRFNMIVVSVNVRVLRSTANIAGFTAWSLKEEPSQVFKIL
jgi:hypothetical protein